MNRLRDRLLAIQRAVADCLAELEPPPAACWPQAIPVELIAGRDDPAALQLLAEQTIAELEPWIRQLKPRSFLHHRCGRTPVAWALADRIPLVVDYDPDHPGPALSDPARMVELGPYDLVLSWDVLDHLPPDRVEATLLAAAGQVAPGGHLFVRFHPWTSRHGAHQYETLNRAYVHLTRGPDELAELGLEAAGWRVNRPLATYEALIKRSGLEVVQRRLDTADPEPYFTGEVLDGIIRATWGAGAVDPATARKIMAINWVDYVLSRPA